MGEVGGGVPGVVTVVSLGLALSWGDQLSSCSHNLGCLPIPTPTVACSLPSAYRDGHVLWHPASPDFGAPGLRKRSAPLPRSHPGPEELNLWTTKEYCVAWQGPTRLCLIFPDALEDTGEAGGQFLVSDVRQDQGSPGGGRGAAAAGTEAGSGEDPAERPQKRESNSATSLQALPGDLHP